MNIDKDALDELDANNNVNEELIINLCLLINIFRTSIIIWHVIIFIVYT
jgi:hypothetical protein